MISDIILQMRHSESYLRQFNPITIALYSHPAIGMVVMDEEGKYLLVNPFAATLIGRSQDDLIGQFHHDIFTESAHQEALNEVSRHYIVSYSFQRPAVDWYNPEMHWEISLSKHCDGESQSHGYLMLIQEASNFQYTALEGTEQKSLFCTLIEEASTRECVPCLRKENNIRLQQIDYAKDFFLSNVSHELKTPLTAIIGWVKVAQEKKTEEITQQALQVIERNAQRQQWLIEDLLTLSNCLAGRLSLELQTFSFSMICRQAIQRVHSALGDIRLTLQMNVPEELSSTADPTRIRQILENVLANAYKFTVAGGIISLVVSSDDGWITIEVVDTGIGVHASDLPFIFDPFWQANSSITRKYRGSGIGLTVVQKLVTLHGGDVWAESDGLHRGTRIVIRIPQHCD